MSSSRIRAVGHRTILDSHVGFTTEFLVELDDGTRGTGSSSQGETISIYEDRGSAVDPRRIVDVLERDGVVGSEFDQAGFDAYLNTKMGDFGRNSCFALSLAFFNAVRNCGDNDASRAAAEGAWAGPERGCDMPRLCLNVLNGGYHAYTNPVFSDFSEFMLVPKENDVYRTIGEHNRIQEAVRERLLSSRKTVVNGNPVNELSARDNAAPLRFLADVLTEIGLREKYDFMIDASAGDLKAAGGYHLAITEDAPRTSEQLLDYWREMIDAYSIGFLEDPFHEEDFSAWQALTEWCGDRCTIIGDNLYSSDAARIARGSREGWSTAAIVKPNQAGTVTATVAAVRAAQAGGQAVITSHRSISTESTYVCDVTCEHSVPYIKIGPLASDYSSVVRLNELLRLSGVGHE